jgi:hypothetical protein
MEFDKNQNIIRLTPDEQSVFKEDALLPYSGLSRFLDKATGIRDGYRDLNPSEIPTYADRRKAQELRESMLPVAEKAVAQLQQEAESQMSSEIEDWLKGS